MYGGGRDAGTIGLDAVDHQRHAVGAGGIVIQKSRHGGDVILIEDRNAVESVAVDGIGILVFRCFSADDRNIDPGRDCNVFGFDRDRHDHAKRNESFGRNQGRNPSIAKSVCVKFQRELARRDVVEVESPDSIGRGSGEDLAFASQQGHLRLSDSGGRRV